MYGFTYRAACPDCGRLIDATDHEPHACVIDVRCAVAAFESSFALWLETPTGLFAAWDAARGR
jgi:hypothetical protein